jgi:hypothetical protein
MMELDYKRITLSILFGGGLGLAVLFLLQKFGVVANIEFICPLITIIVCSNRKYIFK